MRKVLFTFLLAASGFAQAGLFEGSSSGAFVNPVGPSGMVTTGVGTDAFTWGTGVGTPASSLDFLGAAFDEDENSPFTFGTLSYFNGSLAVGSQADTVDLSVSMNFTAPAGFTESFLFMLSLINTPNVGDADENADIVNFDNTVPSNFFSVGGIDYTLEFLGFGALTGEGFTVADSFRVRESGSASVDLVGQITSSPSAVPVPAAAWLFATALLGMAGLRRRNKAA